MIDLLLGGRGSRFRDTGGNMETEQWGSNMGRGAPDPSAPHVPPDPSWDLQLGGSDVKGRCDRSCVGGCVGGCGDCLGVVWDATLIHSE